MCAIFLLVFSICSAHIRNHRGMLVFSSNSRPLIRPNNCTVAIICVTIAYPYAAQLRVISSNAGPRIAS